MTQLFFTLVGSLLFTAPAPEAGDTQKGDEADFVACLAAKDASIISAIRDAESQKAFEEAMKKGAALCEVSPEGFSMGRLFKALNAYKQDKNDA